MTCDIARNITYWTILTNIAQYCPILPNTFHNCPLLSSIVPILARSCICCDIVWKIQILFNCIKYCLILSGIDLYCLALTNIVQWRPVWTLSLPICYILSIWNLLLLAKTCFLSLVVVRLVIFQVKLVSYGSE